MRQKANFRGRLAKIGHYLPILASRTHLFQGLCHGNCELTYVEGFLKLRKLNFRNLKGQFDVKKKFRRLLAKIGH